YSRPRAPPSSPPFPSTTLFRSYFVDGVERAWGTVDGPLATGASVTVGTTSGSYTIADGTHTIMAFADDVNRFPESNEGNNQLSRSEEHTSELQSRFDLVCRLLL